MQDRDFIKPGRAREFFRRLIDDNGDSTNLTKQRLRNTPSSFERVTEDQIIEIKLFMIRDLSVTQTEAKKTYLPNSDVDSHLTN